MDTATDAADPYTRERSQEGRESMYASAHGRAEQALAEAADTTEATESPVKRFPVFAEVGDELPVLPLSSQLSSQSSPNGTESRVAPYELPSQARVRVSLSVLLVWRESQCKR